MPAQLLDFSPRSDVPQSDSAIIIVGDRQEFPVRTEYGMLRSFAASNASKQRAVFPIPNAQMLVTAERHQVLAAGQEHQARHPVLMNLPSKRWGLFTGAQIPELQRGIQTMGHKDGIVPGKCNRSNRLSMTNEHSHFPQRG